MKKVFVTKNVDERNSLLMELYAKGITYRYRDSNSEGDYIVEYEDEDK